MAVSAPLEGEPERELVELRARVAELEARAADAARVDARYRLLLEHLNVGVFISSLEGRMLECNERVVHLSGEPSREALLARQLETTYDRREDRARLVATLRAHGVVRNFETWTRKPDGSRSCTSMNAVLAPLGPNGAPLILGMLEDITDRKLAEERAGEGEQRFRVIAEQSLLGIAIMQDDRVSYVNQAIADLTGFSVEEMRGWHVSELPRVIHPDDAEFALDQARKKRAGDASALPHYEYRIVTKTGQTRWAEQYSRSIEYGGRPADFITIIDITARKLAEQQLSHLALSVERAARLDSLGVLAAGIAHDFNNLLGGLYGHIDLARECLATGDRARMHLDLAEHAFERARALTGQLLAFAKGGDPLRKAGSLARLVRQCVSFALSGSNVHAELDLPAELRSAEFDESQLGQAFDNLLINAKQAMPQGGTVQIAARNAFHETAPAPGLSSGRYVELSFRDAGLGIAKEIVGRIFDPFFTTKAEGSGLGLTAAYAIMKKHHGHIELESNHGQGTTFHVLLPAAQAEPAPSAPPKRAPQSGKGLVLVMDDDDMVRRVATTMLSHFGYEPIPTADGTEAMRAAHALLAEGKQLTAALLDLTVRAGVGGRDIVGPLRELLPTLPIVASSGYSDDPIMATPQRFGFSASLRKPFLLADLGSLLADVIAGQKP